MDIALGLTGLTFIFFWLSTRENIREQHEHLGILFFFLGFGTMIVDALAMAQEARALTYYGVEDMLVVLSQAFTFLFVFVLFYFMLKYSVSMFTWVSSLFQSSGRDDKE